MDGKVIACHQPNFLPWLGFFAKMARSDAFVLLDDVQFTQGHNRHNWTTRVKVLASNGPVWLSVPIRRSGEGKQLITDLRIEPSDGRWQRKVLGTLEAGYGRTPHFSAIYPQLRSLLESSSDRLCELNIALIDHLSHLLEIRTERMRASRLSVSGQATARLIELTRAAGGTTYLCGDGADDYQIQEEFEARGIALRRLGFRHPVYPQRNASEFVAGLSILDALFNVGIEQTRAMLYP